MSDSRDAKALAVVQRFGVPDVAASALAVFICALLEDQGDDGAESIEQALLGTMSADAYYDHLESWCIGHRRLRRWISEKRAGDDVSLTKAGRAIAAQVNAELAIFPAAGGAA